MAIGYIPAYLQGGGSPPGSLTCAVRHTHARTRGTEHLPPVRHPRFSQERIEREGGKSSCHASSGRLSRLFACHRLFRVQRCLARERRASRGGGLFVLLEAFQRRRRRRRKSKKAKRKDKQRAFFGACEPRTGRRPMPPLRAARTQDGKKKKGIKNK